MTILKKRKAPGIDEILNKMIECGENTLHLELQTFFNKILDIRNITSEWKESSFQSFMMLLDWQGTGEENEENTWTDCRMTGWQRFLKKNTKYIPITRTTTYYMVRKLVLIIPAAAGNHG